MAFNLKTAVHIVCKYVKECVILLYLYLINIIFVYGEIAGYKIGIDL